MTWAAAIQAAAEALTGYEAEALVGAAVAYREGRRQSLGLVKPGQGPADGKPLPGPLESATRQLVAHAEAMGVAAKKDDPVGVAKRQRLAALAFLAIVRIERKAAAIRERHAEAGKIFTTPELVTVLGDAAGWVASRVGPVAVYKVLSGFVVGGAATGVSEILGGSVSPGQVSEAAGWLAGAAADGALVVAGAAAVVLVLLLARR